MKRVVLSFLIAELVLFAVCIVYAVYYFFIPAISIWSTGFWVFIIVALLLVALVDFLLMIICDFGSMYVLFLPVIAFVVFVIGELSSWNVFHVEAARDVIRVTEIEDFEEGFPDVLESSGKAFNSLLVVDYDMSKLLGDEKAADIKNATWFDVDEEYNLIKYQDRYYYLSLIDYDGFFKYQKAKQDGLPGYILVEVALKQGTITGEAIIVERPIRYSPGAFREHDLKRHIRSQFRSAILDKSHLEIDERGTPFWVTGVKTPTQGLFGVPVIKSVIITNAETGESYSCGLDDVPEWVDHVFSLGYLMKNTHNHYAYVNGYWNSKVFKIGILRLSYDYKNLKRHKNGDDSEASQFANFYGYSSIVGPDGDVYLYTGLTPADKTEGNCGWLTINTRTGDVKEYKVLGTKEESAQSMVENLVREQRYEATFPLPVNIGGEPCYLMVLKGKSGLVQGYGIVNVENCSIAVVGDTLEDAINKYLAKVGNADEFHIRDYYETDEVARKPEVVEKFGKIAAIYTAELNGTTQFYYVINEEFYRCPITVNEKQVFFKVGDEVIFKSLKRGEVMMITEISLK